jgi:hypothetical protein
MQQAERRTVLVIVSVNIEIKVRYRGNFLELPNSTLHVQLLNLLANTKVHDL